MAVYGLTVPCPEVRLELTPSGKRAALDVRFRNASGGPLQLTQVEVVANSGEKYSSFAEALGPISDTAKYTVAYESGDFSPWTFESRTLGKDSGSRLVASVVPAQTASDTGWYDAFRAQAAGRRVKIHFQYRYLFLPFWGPVLDGTCTCAF